MWKREKKDEKLYKTYSAKQYTTCQKINYAPLFVSPYHIDIRRDSFVFVALAAELIVFRK